MRSWRNWQTRKTKDLVGNSMQVQFLSTAPNKRAPLVGAFLFGMIPTTRRELSVEPRTGVSVLPYETKKTVFTKAKQTIDNRLAGRAAKGAIPGRSLARYSVASLLTTAPQK